MKVVLLIQELTNYFLNPKKISRSAYENVKVMMGLTNQNVGNKKKCTKSYNKEVISE